MVSKYKSVFRPAKSNKHRDDRWNLLHDDFKRGIFYKFLSSGFAYPFVWIAKKYFSKHDTLVTDKDTKYFKQEHNLQFYILRESYKKAFETWFHHYITSGQKLTPEQKKSLRDKYYNSWAQKCIRFNVDMICTIGAEDTVYRELLAVWSFEHQKLMNRVFNPNMPIYHVFYGSYFDRDPRYFEITKALGQMRGKEKRMSGEYQKVVNQEWKKISDKYFAEQEKFLKEHDGQFPNDNEITEEEKIKVNEKMKEMQDIMNANKLKKMNRKVKTNEKM